MAYRDPAVRRQRDRERFRKRTAERVAQGLCPRCGKRPPAEERSLCDPCAEKRNEARAAPATPGSGRKASRAGTPPRRAPPNASGPAARRQGASTGVSAPGAARRRPPPGRASCEPCLATRREADRASYAAGKAAGMLYGGANADAKRRGARAQSSKRQKARREAGLP